MIPSEDKHHLRAFSREVASQFQGVFGLQTVEACVLDSYEQLARTARVRTYLVLLAGRFARERLQAVAKVEGRIMTKVPEVLFVCVHNAGRSQMAAGLLARHARGEVSVRSAGSEPADQLNPAVVEAMREIGIDLSQEFPKPLTEEAVRAADVVITMGCGDACPIYPGKRYMDWDLEDPAGKSIETVRPIRDDIDKRVRELVAELTEGGSGATAE